ncbi:MAG: L-serine ammonia-lyase, iron-sulfur-dependent, subunit alpha [Acidobacteriota bacterium]|nr:L-serine ammonia-lyase, iron-sulfur-dependent, subunit alpha [Acidobacteriota bacterium]
MTAARTQEIISRLIRQEALPSLGCTEPAALAYSAAVASSLVEGDIQHIIVKLDNGTYKNTLAVGLPGTDYRGPAVAAAAGAISADPGLKLRTFEALTPAMWEQAAELSARTETGPAAGVTGVYLHVDVVKSGGKGSASILGRHDRVFRAQVNGKDVSLSNNNCRMEADEDVDDDLIHDLLFNPESLLEALALVSDEDLAFLERGLEMNKAISYYGLDHGAGLGYGKALLETAANGDAAAHAKARVAAAIEARMAGVRMPVMTSGGSGNSGLTVFLGTWAAAEQLGFGNDRERLLRGIALAHLVNIAVKARIGRVGPLCGGSLSSAMGVGCGVAWMLGSDAQGLDRIVRTMTTSVAGTLCDGAKPACAMKVATGLGTALDAAGLAARGLLHPGHDGLAGENAAHAFDHLTKLARVAYVNTDLSLTAILEA